MYEPGARREAMETPGARMSGILPIVARLLNGASSSSDVGSVPLVAAAPTEMIHSLVAGLASAPARFPSLPTAATTTIPACQAFSTAKPSESVYGFGAPPEPYDRLIT